MLRCQGGFWRVKGGIVFGTTYEKKGDSGLSGSRGHDSNLEDSLSGATLVLEVCKWFAPLVLKGLTGFGGVTKEARYGEFGRTTPFNGSNGGKFHVGPPGYYTKIDNRPPYAERRQSLEELLAKHQEEFARRSTEVEVWIKKLKENVEINTKNQDASLKNLETQIEQLTEELRSRRTNLKKQM
ncbi:hypothetical protein Tco_1353661 [Tanacetum coccineum]